VINCLRGEAFEEMSGSCWSLVFNWCIQSKIRQHNVKKSNVLCPWGVFSFGAAP
jgi:hypothetical protein